MNLTEKLYQEFEVELAKSEYQRSVLLVAALIGGVGIISLFVIFSNQGFESLGGMPVYQVGLTWISSFIAFQIYIARWINRRNGQGKCVTSAFKVTQAIVEVTFVSAILYYVIIVMGVHSFIDSPIQFLYFLFIILSILHLDFRLSLLTGALAALEYGLVVYITYHQITPSHEYPVLTSETSHYIRCFNFMMASAVASFVAQEVKLRIRTSLDFKLQKSEVELHLGQQVSQEILATLTQNGGSVKKVEATVLALDIRGFTKFAEGKSLDEIHDYQNKFFDPVMTAVTRHRGVVNQILGDGIMATFGAISDNPLHADMAFQASLEILSTIRHLSIQGAIPYTRVGIGLHSGEVIAGNIGNESRKQYSVSGTPVIIAFRLEQLNKDFDSELLITSEVYNRIARGSISFTELGNMPLKGLENRVDIFRVDLTTEDSRKSA